MLTDDEPAVGWTVVLRRLPAGVAGGRVAGGRTDVYELVCCECGDDPDLDYCEVSPEVQRVRGPYPFVAGVAAYGMHVMLRHGQQLVPAADRARGRAGDADGRAG